jgi:hypothetical protein
MSDVYVYHFMRRGPAGENPGEPIQETAKR